jgi:hypothetical protein
MDITSDNFYKWTATFETYYISAHFSVNVCSYFWGLMPLPAGNVSPVQKQFEGVDDDIL